MHLQFFSPWLSKVKRETHIIASVLCYVNLKKPEGTVNGYNIFLIVW